jgi:hypothetical protein
MNILAMAEDLPRATFLGVDISPRQIEEARESAASLGLTNIEFRCASFENLFDIADKSFDYIICHGVLSWVNPALRKVILDLVKRLLADDGVAYISYNVFPGWHFGHIVRELMLRESDASKPPLERVFDARLTLDRHLEAAEDKSLRRALLLAEKETLEGHSDSYLYHEYLTPEHHPLYFSDFVEIARASGLAYVTDALPGIVLPATQDPRIRNLIDHLPPERQNDPIAQQQAIDEQLNNRFRRSLLVHDHHRPALTLDPASLAPLHLRLPRDHILVREAHLAVRSRRGHLIPLHPSVEPILERLRTASPASLPLAELIDIASATHQGIPLRAIIGTLVGLIFAEVLEPTLTPISCASTLPERPAVTPLNRLQASRQTPIGSRLFASEQLGDLGYKLVALCDGTRTVEEIFALLDAPRDQFDVLFRALVEHGVLLAPP